MKMMRRAKLIFGADPKECGWVAGGRTHSTITIRNDLLPKGVYEALIRSGEGDFGGLVEPEVDLTKEDCEQLADALSLQTPKT